ncbi:DNA/RNA non-specific endonuclease [Minwuia sp.]|uniref:DNA/RNA non-specific endonuclease n=1 Tax=Minwuia sp. TaxID=2493630 RepID=UPI003A919DC5
MAKKSAKSRGPKKPDRQHALRQFIRARGADYLEDPNVTSIGVGRKNGDGPLSIVFTVGTKAETSMLEHLGTRELPTEIEVDGFTVPTDVIARKYTPSYRMVEPEGTSHRKVWQDPIYPGISVSHARGASGTIGLIVFDEETGAPCILSNWHVLHTDRGQIGDRVVQPGLSDDNNARDNGCGTLLRSHLGAAGDCALARISGRGFSRKTRELGVTAERLADVELDDTIIKSGRTTAVTHGKVRRTDVMVKIHYGPGMGTRVIGGFEIGPDEEHPAPNDEISQGGDSGAAWMIAKDGKATDIFAGLHFAGETGDNPDEHAIACYPRSVQKKLRFRLDAPEPVSVEGALPEDFGARHGYDPGFLEVPAPMPGMSHAIKIDAVNFGRAQTIPYTHFSVCLSARHRLARFVAWNIDGERKVTVKSVDFRRDPRIDRDLQWGNELYEDNPLDRGHIARRADLAWGTVAEARQANADSFFYTNIAPQHQNYNRSSLKGIWGALENTILEHAESERIRVSVLAGPIFEKDDPCYRGARIPRSYWKLIAYRHTDGALSASAFVLSQKDLLHGLEAIDFEPFRLYQIAVSALEERTGLGFEAYRKADAMHRPERIGIEQASTAGKAAGGTPLRTIESLTDIRF